jgi:hypothetical protein
VSDDTSGGLYRDGHAVADDEQNVLRLVFLGLGRRYNHNLVSHGGLAIVIAERSSVLSRLAKGYLTVCLGGDIVESQFL